MGEPRHLTEHSDRLRFYRGVKEEILKHPELSLGFALLWAWIRLLFETSVFDGSLFFGYATSMPAWLLVTLANALTYLFLGYLFRKKGVVPHSKTYRWSIAVSMCLGALLCAFVTLVWAGDDSLGSSLFAAGALLVGIGTACLYVEWGRVLGFLGPRPTLIHAAIGILGAAFISVALFLLPNAATYVYAICVPPMILVILSHWLNRYPSLHKHGINTASYVPWRLVATVILVGASSGIAFEIPNLGNYLDAAMLRNALTLATAAILLFFAALFFKMDFNHLIYRVGFPVICAGYLVFIFLRGELPIGGYVYAVGFAFLDQLFWVLVAYVIMQQEVSANFIVGLTTGSLLLGRMIGGLIGSAAANFSDSPNDNIFNLLVAAIFVLLVAALLMFNKRNLQIGWGTVKPIEEPAITGIDLACRLISHEYNLTMREAEILVLLAKGRNRALISETLVVSVETIRTHTANLYRKLGIHSHQELIDLVESRVQTFDSDDARIQTVAF
ncbi:MAG: response regulator transcription factor [Coriobacteriia bacterium]